MKQLWAHQKRAIEEARGRDYFALFHEVGTGKSLTLLNILRNVYKREGSLLKTLIVCPIIVIENWKREIYENTKVNPSLVTPLLGTGKKRAKDFEKAIGACKERIVIVNYESLLIKGLYPLLFGWKPDVIVYDEAHYLKDIKSKRTRAAVRLSDRASYRFLATGTPVLNTPMDLFGQYRVMDCGENFGKNFYVFKIDYFYDKNEGFKTSPKYFPDWRVKKDSWERFNAIINSTSSVAKKSECLDLPPFVRKPIYIDLSREQRRVYDELKKDLISYLNDKACVAQLAITKSLRLQQIASGFVVGEDMDGERHEIQVKDNPRAKALEELLKDLAPNHKIIVWAVFKNNYKTIREVCEKLKLKYVEVNGEIKNKDKFANVDTFNSDPNCRVFIGHPNSGGVGINLVASSISIFYSRNFSLGQDLQAEARNYRGGSEIHESITRIDLIAKGTIDEVVQIALSNKQGISDKLLKKAIKEL